MRAWCVVAVWRRCCRYADNRTWKDAGVVSVLCEVSYVHDGGGNVLIVLCESCVTMMVVETVSLQCMETTLKSRRAGTTKPT